MCKRLLELPSARLAIFLWNAQNGSDIINVIHYRFAATLPDDPKSLSLRERWIAQQDGEGVGRGLCSRRFLYKIFFSAAPRHRLQDGSYLNFQFSNFPRQRTAYALSNIMKERGVPLAPLSIKDKTKG